MTSRIIAFALLTGTAMTSACSTVHSHPDEWHAADDVAYVYGSVPTKQVKVSPNGRPVTLIDVVMDYAVAGSDVSCVTIRRGSGADALRIDVNVKEMLQTGRTAANFQLRAGDVVVIPD